MSGDRRQFYCEVGKIRDTVRYRCLCCSFLYPGCILSLSLSGTVGMRSVQGPYCSVLYRTTAHGADGDLFYHKLQYITVNTEIKLSAGGYHFCERCQYVLYPSPPPNHLPRKYLAAYEAPAAMLEQANSTPFFARWAKSLPLL
jgi:hypothetical protein